MIGFSLPKLRWLVIGAAAAGVWAMNQEPPGKAERRSPAPRSTERAAVVSSAREFPAKVKPATARTLFTRERVRLRANPSTNAPVLVWLEPGQRLAASQRAGSWHRVLAGVHRGWVHDDYVSASDPTVRRPLVSLTRKPEALAMRPTPRPFVPAMLPPAPIVRTTAPVETANEGLAAPFSRRPARAPQNGDCQCPYDLMISGKQCGDHSAYVMRGRAKESCYL